MSAANFDLCFAATETWEGWHKFSDSPGDPGGATWCGLTWRAYNAWRKSKGLPTQFVRRATDDEIKQIFHDEYWELARCDDCFDGLDLMLFDIAINTGPAAANKMVQRSLRVKADGWFGLETLAALEKITSMDERKSLIKSVASQRMSFWHALRTWRLFSSGWSARGVDIEVKALSMVKAVTSCAPSLLYL
jgi:lysozyme family protein